MLPVRSVWAHFAGPAFALDGFVPDATIRLIIEGENPATMAKSTGLGLLELPTVFEMLRPDIVVTVADRFEALLVDRPDRVGVSEQEAVRIIQGAVAKGELDPAVVAALAAHVRSADGGR